MKLHDLYARLGENLPAKVVRGVASLIDDLALSERVPWG